MVLTGAAQGLGQKKAEIVAGQRSNLALLDFDHCETPGYGATLRRLGRQAKDYAADVTNESSVETLFKRTDSDFGSVDGLINNAGVAGDALLCEGSEWEDAAENVDGGIRQGDRG